MYAHATHIQFDPGMTDEAISIIRDIILPNAKKQKGFKGALLLRDVDTDKSLVITLWTTVEDLMASSPPEVIQADLDRLEELTSGTPTQEIYGVLLHL
jgi:heme-degrading monooxygenase HmoA